MNPVTNRKQRQEILLTYISLIDSIFIRLLYRIGVYKFIVVRENDKFRIGCKLRWYHPVAMVLYLFVLIVSIIIRIIEAVYETWKETFCYSYDAYMDEREFKNKFTELCELTHTLFCSKTDLELVDNENTGTIHVNKTKGAIHNNEAQGSFEYKPTNIPTEVDDQYNKFIDSPPFC